MESLNQLIEQQSLSFEQATELFGQVMQGALSEVELTAALIALKIKGETASEIAGAAKAMRDHAVAFDNRGLYCADSCGTGGDGTNTINVSTTAAIVAAACGIPMVKHGNRSVSSKSGSADLLRTLGINLEMTPEQGANCLEQTNFAFLFAPLYHSGVKHAMPVRTKLKTRTLFNILGPLANPAKPQLQLLGVYDPALCRPMAETLKMLGTERAMVVHGAGCDEIALHGTTQVTELKNGEITEYSLTPADFGLDNYSLEDIAGDTPEYNAQATRDILAGNGKAAHNAAIAANVSALLVMSGKADNLKEGTKQVLDVLASGKCVQTLQTIAEVSHA
ncbi:anthranilate phosphoribosyltransferase [Pseudoalteromonas luteoviolacea]|uniref:Anthranilate phosphoribosyltransferase n=1 Tax=Pseudoalteromonas luteoviolacea S4054 TaxID=1129367 RepID=A0A0F6A3T3_9GAMM|nr:anthranilate phosphoribosyltransferase [Pseudoalteromonas luteoviolacea]AOT08948.1 anthranilate phosphoribosyltransferase [Pseudoalteromonas luteoviolacea]AOT13860.1 anthranilate phosphoribosyltransferase [Pseudoalteromonas luteoviolacea]AOT18775.1 anthranilate phosphoribosyltransferase [Pseudoalteromonas luteoviolacea]KKE80852.1 anthranilate phosphoribosyltransferase [Pseudoalteromonas luteoviolacea S4054]KZN71014.1 anthranilate phosphoribosyltransferase [Pseudoalteromonas luteoviolacea S4